MKLFIHPFSQNARKARIVASITGAPVELATVDLMKGGGSDPAYLELNPNGMVPTLVDGDFVLWESNAICHYLATSKPNALWPADRRHQAEVLKWMSWELAHWGPTLFYFFKENMIKQFIGGGAPDPVEIRKGETELAKFGGVLDGCLAGRPFLVNNHLTLADICVGSHLMHAEMGKVPLENFPNIRRWYQALSQLPAWGDTAP